MAANGPNDQVRLPKRSRVAFTEIGGDAAVNQVAFSPSNNQRDVKCLTGQRFDGLYESDKDPIIRVWCNGEEKQYTTEQISRMVLEKLTQMGALTDHHLNSVVRMIDHRNGPVAAAIAYCFAKKVSLVDGMNILVFGLGDRTINAVLLAMEDGILKVKATDGDTIGGNDFVHRMVGHVIKEFDERHTKNLSGHPIHYCRSRVWARCEEAVKVLSSAQVVTIEVKSLFEGIDLRCSITRDKFEKLNMDLFDRCLIPVKKCLKQAGMEGSFVQSLVIGSSIKIPRVQHLLQNLLSSEQVLTFINSPKDESFARSAAVLSHIISSNAPKNTPIISSILMFDVTPHSLGLLTVAGMAVLIPKNSPIPVSVERHFATVSDDQSFVAFRMRRVIGECEVGERGQCDVCGPVNEFVFDVVLKDITRAPKGVATIKVCFAIDNEGLLEVSAEDVTEQRLLEVSAEDVTEQRLLVQYRAHIKVEKLVAQS